MRGRTEFLAGEGDNDRLIVELGPFPGIAFMLFRWGLALTLVVRSLLRAREGEALALLFAPLAFSAIALGVLEQPTGQGFMVMFLAFMLAALNRPRVAVLPASAMRRNPRPLRYSAVRRPG